MTHHSSPRRASYRVSIVGTVEKVTAGNRECSVLYILGYIAGVCWGYTHSYPDHVWQQWRSCSQWTLLWWTLEPLSGQWMRPHLHILLPWQHRRVIGENVTLMMTSSMGLFSALLTLLWGEHTGDRWIPLTKTRYAGLKCFYYFYRYNHKPHSIQMALMNSYD